MKSESAPGSGADVSVGMLRVVFADDSPVARETIGGFLKSHPRIASVVICEDGESAIKASLETHPDVVFIDVNMPGMNGFETAKILRTCIPDAAIITVSAETPSGIDAKSISHGADGFVAKSRFAEKIDQTLDRALRAAKADSRYREHELRGKRHFQGASAVATAGCMTIR